MGNCRCCGKKTFNSPYTFIEAETMEKEGVDPWLCLPCQEDPSNKIDECKHGENPSPFDDVIHLLKKGAVMEWDDVSETFMITMSGRTEDGPDLQDAMSRFL